MLIQWIAHTWNKYVDEELWFHPDFLICPFQIIDTFAGTVRQLIEGQPWHAQTTG